jgi:hypothetical protein
MQRPSNAHDRLPFRLLILATAMIFFTGGALFSGLVNPPPMEKDATVVVNNEITAVAFVTQVLVYTPTPTPTRTPTLTPTLNGYQRTATALPTKTTVPTETPTPKFPPHSDLEKDSQSTLGG